MTRPVAPPSLTTRRSAVSTPDASPTSPTRRRSLSGIKPTGNPHVGNYLGMIAPAIELQEEFEAFYFVADYHALTTMRDAEALRDLSYEITAYFLAFGLDPGRAAFFRQSDVPEVTELTWMLSCVTNMGLLQRAHAYKAALDQGQGGQINHGLFTYPVLMAADILIYDSDVVPVGADQIQHLEMTRDMAVKFNMAFDREVFKLPEARISDRVATVPGLDGQKMSKSYNNIIEPLLPAKKLRKQIMSIQTGSTPMDQPLPTEGDNVLALYELFASEQEVAQMREDYTRPDFGYGHAKQALYLKMDEVFSPHRARYDELIADRDYLEDVLRAGAERVSPVVEDVMARAREATGMPTHPHRAR